MRLADDPLWYKDAIIYELHVRAFYDSNANGVGDFRGLTQKLDYLQDLGVTALWLLPFCPSPLKDDGYDMADYTDVHPLYGTLADFEFFLREAHQRGIRVITELALNHTSDQHPYSNVLATPSPGVRGATSTCGVTPRRNTRTHGSSLRTLSRPIGRGTRLQKAIIGIASILTSQT